MSTQTSLPVSEPDVQRVDLQQAVSHLLEEGRMVQPGVQALFGFQLIAVFNETFHERLTDLERDLHLVAVGLCILTIIAILAPAAYHRQAEPRSISKHFLRCASHALTVGMAMLMCAIALDFFLICQIIVKSTAMSACFAGIFLVIATLVWFVYPRCARTRRTTPSL